MGRGWVCGFAAWGFLAMGGLGVWWAKPPTDPAAALIPSAEEWRDFHARSREENDRLLGVENSTLCLRDDAGQIVGECVDPAVISLMCDMSQINMCQNIAQGIRWSDKMFLLHPLETDAEIRARPADYTIMISNSPGESSHDIVVFKGFFSTKKGDYAHLKEIGRISTASRGFEEKMTFSFSLSSSKTLSEVIEGMIYKHKNRVVDSYEKILGD